MKSQKEATMVSLLESQTLTVWKLRIHLQKRMHLQKRLLLKVRPPLMLPKASEGSSLIRLQMLPKEVRDPLERQVLLMELMLLEKTEVLLHQTNLLPQIARIIASLTHFKITEVITTTTHQPTGKSMPASCQVRRSVPLSSAFLTSRLVPTCSTTVCTFTTRTVPNNANTDGSSSRAQSARINTPTAPCMIREVLTTKLLLPVPTAMLLPVPTPMVLLVRPAPMLLRPHRIILMELLLVQLVVPTLVLRELPLQVLVVITTPATTKETVTDVR
jgi:hypothetical protein